MKSNLFESVRSETLKPRFCSEDYFTEYNEGHVGKTLLI